MLKKAKVAGLILPALLLAAGSALAAGIPAVEGPSRQMKADDRTIFLLQVDGGKNELVDRKGAFKPTVKGWQVVGDTSFGKCLESGEDGKNSISVADSGKIKFDGGFTAEAWVYLKGSDKPASGTFMNKFGSFYVTLKENKLNNGWLTLPTDRVVTTDKKQLNYYPVETEGFGGAVTIPTDRWVHLAISYDQPMKVIRTWVDGGLDRIRYVDREGDMPVLCNPSKAVDFLTGMKNCRVGAIRLSQGARRIGEAPLMETYVQQLPWQNKIAIAIDHIDRSLPLPIEVAITLENPAGPAAVIRRETLDSFDRRVIMLDVKDMRIWHRSIWTLIIRAYSDSKQIYTRTSRTAPTLPSGRVKIGADRSFTIDGKKIFPLVAYGAPAGDLKELGEIGFNLAFARESEGPRWKSFQSKLLADYSDIQKYMDEAQKTDVHIIMGAGPYFGHMGHVPVVRDNPALAVWAIFDEPWGTLDKVIDSYNSVKILSPDLPIYCVQNNMTRFAETAEGADIVACDPYPIPLVSLRAVAHHTGALVRAVDGLKPVWTTLDQYEYKQPSLQELRCMAWLAITAGANGIGIYSWDERPYGKPGWYTREQPEGKEILRTVIQELKGQESMLVIPNSGRKLAWSPSNKALHAAIKEDGKNIWLIVANDSRGEESAELTIDGLGSAKGICLLSSGEKKDIAVNNGRVSFKMSPLGTAVYKLDAQR